MVGLGHLFKETAFFIFAFLFIFAIAKRRFKKELVFALLGFLVIPFIELIIYWLITGDPLHRYAITFMNRTWLAGFSRPPPAF